jgi:hypothetical protein
MIGQIMLIMLRTPAVARILQEIVEWARYPALAAFFIQIGNRFSIQGFGGVSYKNPLRCPPRQLSRYSP